MRFEKTKIKLESTSIEVWEDSCRCGSCDTIAVVADWGEENPDEFEHYTAEGGYATKLDPYDQIQHLKQIILELVKLHSLTIVRADQQEVGSTTGR